MPEGPTVSNSSCLIALEAVGSLGILEQLYGTIAVPDAGVIPKVRALLDVLITANFRVSDALVQEVLRKAGE